MRTGRGVGVALMVAAIIFTWGMAAAAAPPTMEWISMKKPMPVPVSWGAGCAYQGKVYVIGGIRYDDPSVDAGDCPLIQIYDIATDTWTMGTPRKYSLRLSSAAAIDGKIYVTGGRDPSAAYDYNEIYDIATDTWSDGRKMPSVLRGHTALALNGKIYTFGGNRGLASAIYSKNVNVYDPATNTWTTAAPAPKAWAYGGAAYCSSTGKVYFASGDDGSCSNCDGEFPRKSYGYDVAANTWDTIPADLPNPAGYPGIHLFGIASSADKVYTFGGGWNDAAAGYDQAPFPFVYSLDAATNTWGYGPTLPAPIERFTTMCGTDGGMIYVAGGRQDAGPSSVLKGPGYIEVLDPSTDKYFAPYPDSPDVRLGAAVQSVGTKVYAIGGTIDVAYGSVFVFDTVAKTWSTTNSVDPTPRYMGVSGVWNGKIVISGGQSDTTGDPDYCPIPVGGDTTLYDPAADTFTALAPDPAARSDAFGAVLGDTLYVFGGDDAAGALLTTANALDLNTNTWTSLPPLPLALANATALASGGKVFILGGHDGKEGPDDGLNAPVIIYDPATRGYTTGAESPYPTIYSAGVVYNGYLVLDAGMHRYYDAASGYVYSELSYDQQVYNPATNTWTLMPRLWGKWAHGAALVGSKLFSVMGQDWSYLASRVDVAELNEEAPPCTLDFCTAAAAPTSGQAPLAVAFTSTVSTSGTCGDPTYAWTFGDGATSTEQNPNHTYAAVGTYDWTYTVTVDTQTCTRSGSITVIPVCWLECTATVPANGTASVPVPFASTATPHDCTGSVTYAWTFGDGATSTEQNPSHTYAMPGIFNWELTVTIDGITCSKTGSISITSQPYDITLFDDMGRARLCLNSTTGAFSWTVFRGVGVGSYAGRAILSRYNGVLYINPPLGFPWRISGRIFERYHRATAEYDCPAMRIRSILLDSNTTNDPPGC